MRLVAVAVHSVGCFAVVAFAALCAVLVVAGVAAFLAALEVALPLPTHTRSQPPWCCFAFLWLEISDRLLNSIGGRKLTRQTFWVVFDNLVYVRKLVVYGLPDLDRMGILIILMR